MSITGRIKDIIIRGGENIAPKEVEDVLRTHPAIADASVYARGERVLRRGSRGGAAPASGASIVAEEVQAFCRERIARFKVPRFIKIRRRLPADRVRQDSEVPLARSALKRS